MINTVDFIGGIRCSYWGALVGGLNSNRRKTPETQQRRKKLKTYKALSAGALVAVAAPAFASDIVIGVPNWSSVNATAHVLEIVIEENLGLDVELQNGTMLIVTEN